jgi:hypothetical protein
MTLRFISKCTVSLGALLALGVFAKAPPFITSAIAAENVVIAQYYYPQPGYGRNGDPYDRPQYINPKHTCIQKAGDIFRIPSKEVRAIDVRQIDRDVYQMVVSGRGRTANCTADSRGNVLSFQ